MIRIESTTTVETVLISFVCIVIVIGIVLDLIKLYLERKLAREKKRAAELAGRQTVNQFAQKVRDTLYPDEDCPACGVRLESLAGNPSLWPVYVCDGHFQDPPDPGVGRNYCHGCVSKAMEKYVKGGG